MSASEWHIVSALHNTSVSLYQELAVLCEHSRYFKNELIRTEPTGNSILQTNKLVRLNGVNRMLEYLTHSSGVVVERIAEVGPACSLRKRFSCYGSQSFYVTGVAKPVPVSNRSYKRSPCLMLSSNPACPGSDAFSSQVVGFLFLLRRTLIR